MNESFVIATASSGGTGGTVTAAVNGVSTTVWVSRGITVASGDRLVLCKIGQLWWVVSIAYNSAPAGGGGGTPPPTGGSTGTTTFAPVTTQTYRGGKWRTDTGTEVIQGDWSATGNNTGTVFYGSGPQSLAGATVTAASAQIRRVSGGNNAGFATKLWLVTEATRPAGAPTLGSSTTGPSLAVGATSTFVVPTAWAQAMVNGTAGGIAFQDTATQAHYAKFAGLSEWAAAFTLSITWSR